MTTTLEQWIHDATRGLGRWAQRRVATEISQHYDEACRGAVEGGLGAEEAEALALDSLGDAEEACVRFQQTHLTVEEEYKLSKLLSNNDDEI